MRVGAACPCISTLRGPRLSLAGCPRLVRTYGCVCPPRTCAAAGGRSSGGGRIHPLVPDVLPAETAASGAERRSVRRSDPQARASTRSSRGGAPSTSLVPSLTHGGGEHRPKAAALAALPHCRLQWGLGVGPTTWRRARVTVGMVTMVLLRTDPPPPCLAQRAPCRGGPAGGGGGSGDGGEVDTDGHCGRASALAESRAGAVRAPWDSACSLLASVLAASGRG